MAAISGLPLFFCCRAGASSSSSSPWLLSFPSFTDSPSPFRRNNRRKQIASGGTALSAVTDGETLTLGETEDKETPVAEDPVTVAVSPSDVLTMFFKAEGMMDESAVSTVSKALQESEGISDLKVQIAEGIALVELKKQTTVQATGVASGLVETIQGLGFKLQSLNLSFEDEEDAVK